MNTQGLPNWRKTLVFVSWWQVLVNMKTGQNPFLHEGMCMLKLNLWFDAGEV
jgi:hypothetical protein